MISPSGPGAIGRITMTGKVTVFTNPAIDDPNAITTGPDGALRFTNSRHNSIGRITTGGTVTTFTGPSIQFLSAITPGPDRALWFPIRDYGRTRWRAMVRLLRRKHHRADHHIGDAPDRGREPAVWPGGHPGDRHLLQSGRRDQGGVRRHGGADHLRHRDHGGDSGARRSHDRADYHHHPRRDGNRLVLQPQRVILPGVAA